MTMLGLFNHLCKLKILLEWGCYIIFLLFNSLVLLKRDLKKFKQNRKNWISLRNFYNIEKLGNAYNLLLLSWKS